MSIAVGVDIGGSHISSAAVNTDTNQIVSGTYFNSPVNNKASKEEILSVWGSVINQTMAKIERGEILGIGLAMPGPFQYKTGIAMFERNDKYEALYEVSIVLELPKYLNKKDLPIRFLNDASSFGVGGALLNKMQNNQNITAVTLGTGFGAAFLMEYIPVIQGENVPENGCLWDKSFLEGIADDYFSTRWFLSRYKELSGGKSVSGVKEIVDAKNNNTIKIFDEFAQNMSDFMYPYILKFDVDLLVIGGNITKAQHLFLPSFIRKLEGKKLNMNIAIIENTEECIIIGSSYLFNTDFWEKVQNELPEI